jgi:hypothetical protein
VTGSDYYMPLGMRAYFTLTAGSLPFVFLSNNSTNLEFYQTNTANGGPVGITNTTFDTGTEFNINFWYLASS